MQKKLIMEDVTGIMFETDTTGQRTHVRIDLRRFGIQIMPFLVEIGAVEDDRFQKDWERALSVDEFKNEMFNRIDKWIEK